MSESFKKIFKLAGLALPFLLALAAVFFKDQFSGVGEDAVYLLAGTLFLTGIIQVVLAGVAKLLGRSAHKSDILNEKDKDAADRLSQMIKIDRLKTDFLSIAQHQLRTPLSGVKWALEMLKADTSISLDSQSLIDQSLARVQDSLAIVNQMLTTVEAEDTPTLQIESLDLVGMVQGILAELNFLVVKKEVKLTFIRPDVLLIPADRNKMKAALMNVVDNAIKYSPKGKVDVSIVETPESAQLIVKDTGIGIPDDDLPYIFERLHRAKNAVLMEPDESGVGLSISRKIISLHGGTVIINSQLGKGTTVQVILPKQK